MTTLDFESHNYLYEKGTWADYAAERGSMLGLRVEGEAIAREGDSEVKGA